jgi:hypothetical protein
MAVPFNAVEEVLAQFPWLSMLGDDIYQVLVDGITTNQPFDVIVQNVRDTPAYKTRFAGMATRLQAGLPAITEAEYLTIEVGYQNQLREFGILGTLGLTSQEALQQWAADKIGKNVSVAEVNRRLDKGAALARDSSDFAQARFSEWYGAPITDDAMLVWFLDEEQGMDIIEDQIATAQVGGEAFRYGLNISRTRAEILRREGVTADLAKQGFADIARETPVLSRLAQIHRDRPLTQMELEEFFFHEDPEIAARRNQLFTKSLAQFQGSGATNRTQQGGLGELLERDRSV